MMRSTIPFALFALTVLSGCGNGDSRTRLLNVSYDPTRELWRDLNAAFIREYREETGRELVIDQSHGGSSSQARAVVEGLEADVVTLALWSDTDAVHRFGLIRDGWEDRLPNRSLPYYSTIVFVVRNGNPKNVRDWTDLVKDDIRVITPNPKTSGNGRLSFLAAWGFILDEGGNEDEARAFVKALYRNVPVLDSGARGSTATFAQKKIGDVHLTWENEAHLEVAESGGDLEIVYPPTSIRAEPFVAVVDENVDAKGTRAEAEAYLRFLYTSAAQEIIARHHYRPIDKEVFARHTTELPPIRLFPVTVLARGWEETQERFFQQDGVFDQIYQVK